MNEAMYCGDCGTKNTENASYCSKCGRAIVSSPDDHSIQQNVTGAGNGLSQSYYEVAIGPKNTHYYLSHFQRFDTAGAGVSWNWPSFFVTFYWFLYRKMWGWALLYYALPVLFGFLIGLFFGDSETGGALFSLAYLAVVFLIFPMYANALYYRNIKKKIQQVASTSDEDQKKLLSLAVKGGTSNVIVILVAIFSLIFVIGILAAIALPAYQDYIIRSKMAEPISVLAEYKTEVSEYYVENGSWPKTISKFESSSYSQPSIVQGVTIDHNGVLRVTLTGVEQLEGKSFELRPQINPDYSISWNCGNVDIEPRYLPASCRN